MNLHAYQHLLKFIWLNLVPKIFFQIKYNLLVEANKLKSPSDTFCSDVLHRVQFGQCRMICISRRRYIALCCLWIILLPCVHSQLLCAFLNRLFVIHKQHSGRYFAAELVSQCPKYRRPRSRALHKNKDAKERDLWRARAVIKFNICRRVHFGLISRAI